MNAPVPATLNHAPTSSIALYLEKTLFDQVWTAAKLVANAAQCPDFYRGKPEACFVALDIADKLNLPIMTVLQNTYAIGGRPGFMTQFLIGLANQRRAFATPIKFRVSGAAWPDGPTRAPGDLAVTAYATLHDGETVEETVTLAEAVADGWAAKNPKYRSIPDRMLKYRAASALIGFYAPEIKLGFPTVEELADGEYVDAVPLPDGSFGVPVDRPVRPEPSHQAAPAPTPAPVPPSQPQAPAHDPGQVRQSATKRAESGPGIVEAMVAAIGRCRTVTDLHALLDREEAGINALTQANRIAIRKAADQRRGELLAGGAQSDPAASQASSAPADQAADRGHEQAKPVFRILDRFGEEAATYTQAKRAADAIVDQIRAATSADDIAAIMDHNDIVVGDLPDEHAKRVQDAAADRTDALRNNAPAHDEGPHDVDQSPTPAAEAPPPSAGAFRIEVTQDAKGQPANVAELFAKLKIAIQKAPDLDTIEGIRNDNLDRLEFIKANSPAWAKALSDMLAERRTALG